MNILSKVAITLFFIYMLVGIIATYNMTAEIHTALVIIHEDDPRWDCRTMGNQICGTMP